MLIKKEDYNNFLDALTPGSVDLVLTDPPYCISKKTGFKSGKLDKLKINTEFGDWDKSEIDLLSLTKKSYKCLRPGGTCIIFYDIWKLSYLKEALEEAGFKQIRFIEWVKTNPVPINSKINYLTNSREIALLGIKVSKPTFNSSYDKGIYEYAIPREKGKDGKRYHPTQKPLKLFSSLVEKHSNEGDLVVDPFLGSGTTALVCKNLNRQFSGCDISSDYINIVNERLNA